MVNNLVLFNTKKNIFFYIFLIANYLIPNIPANGWWHEWTYNYDVKVDNSEVHLDIAEREAKILVWRGDDYQPPAPEPAAEPAPEPTAEPTAESAPADQSKDASQGQPKPDSSTNQNPESTQSEVPSQ